MVGSLGIEPRSDGLRVRYNCLYTTTLLILVGSLGVEPRVSLKVWDFKSHAFQPASPTAVFIWWARRDSNSQLSRSKRVAFANFATCPLFLVPKVGIEPTSQPYQGWANPLSYSGIYLFDFFRFSSLERYCRLFSTCRPEICLRNKKSI